MIKRKLKLKKSIKITLLLSLVLIIDLFCINTFRPNFKIKNYQKNVVLNYGSNNNYTPSVCYGVNGDCRKLEYSISGNVDYNTIGTYKVEYTYNYNNKKITIEQNIEVKDLEAPKIELNNENILICPNGKILNLDLDAKDNYDGDLKEKITTEINNNKIKIKAIDSNGNKIEKEYDAIIEDKEAPTIQVNGPKNKTIIVRTNYNDEGATATDNCDESIEIKTEGTVDSNKVGTYTIKYIATDSSNNTKTEERKVIVKNREEGSRIIYLTFDDGPGAYTSYLLDILKKYNVKATFFVTGKGDDNIIKREYDEGHKVALHSNTHNYSYIYSSIDNYFSDLYAIRDRVKRITGYESNIIRFPGGASNTVSKNYDGGTKIMSKLTKEVQNRGFYYFDWNVSSGDAGGTTSSDQVYNNVVSNLKPGASVVLQHDIKKFSVDAVERIIQYGLENGYTFKTLDETSPIVHHGVNN